jgi:hypothetical protein
LGTDKFIVVLHFSPLLHYTIVLVSSHVSSVPEEFEKITDDQVNCSSIYDKLSALYKTLFATLKSEIITDLEKRKEKLLEAAWGAPTCAWVHRFHSSGVRVMC